MSKIPELLTRDEVARRLGFSPSTLDNWRSKRRGPPYVKAGGVIRYRDLYDFGRLMIQQGCRPEEPLELEKLSVDLMNHWLYIATGKTKAARRRLKLTPESAAILARRIQSEPGPYVFPSPKNPQSHRGPTWRVHGEALEATKHLSPRLSFVIYDFRHTFATRAAADGMPLATLAAILGHSRNSLRCVMKYVHVDAGSIDAETMRMEQIRASRRLSEQTKSFAGFLPVTPLEMAKRK
jgi:integrase